MGVNGLKKRMTADRIYFLISGIVVQIALLIPWIPLNGTYHSTFTYLIRLARAENKKVLMLADMESMGVVSSEGMNVESVMIIFRVMLCLLVVQQILGLLGLLLCYIREQSKYLPFVNLVVCCLVLLSSVVGPAFYDRKVLFQIYPMIILLLECAQLVVTRMLDSWEDASEEMYRIRERDLQMKKERKERLRFEGKYSPLFYQVIWKNFKSNWETYRIFMVVGTISVSFVFAGIGIREMLSEMKSVENLAMGQGLGAILMNFLIAAIVIAVFLIVSVLIFYLKNHISRYTLFQNLGIRSRTLYLFIGMELMVCLLVSLAGGYLVGNMVLLACRSVIRQGLQSAVTLGTVTIKSYLFTFLVFLLILLVSAMATHDIYIEMGGSSSRYQAVQKEKMPGKFSPVLLALGMVLICVSLIGFTQRKHAEGMSDLILFLAGLYLFLRHFWNLYLRHRKKKDAVYYQSLLKNNYFYHHFKTAYRYLYLMTLLHFCVLFVFARESVASFTAEDPETLYPYDYVCMAIDDDKEIFERIENENHADVETYPMVRVSSVDNSPDINATMECILPQGQHIGISESTYRILCEKAGYEAKDLELADDGSEVYIIYQEDKSVKAHPLDYFAGKKLPYLHVGQPVVSYDYIYREDIFPPRQVVGEERKILIGDLRQGEHENIVVFSDVYFEQAMEMWKTTDVNTGMEISEAEGSEGDHIHHWPDRLVMIRAQEEQKSEIEEKLHQFEMNHKTDTSFDSVVQAWYSKDQLMDQMRAERFMNGVVGLFVMILMTVVSLVLLYMKVESEMKEKIRQQEFLQNMGMRKKERMQIIRREIWCYLWIPMAVSIVSAAVFTWMMWSNRGYTMRDCMIYLKLFVPIALCYIGIQTAGVLYLCHCVIKKVEAYHGNDH